MEERVESYHPEEVPAEIQKWNWGAFFLNWIWGIAHNVWIALLCFIPVVNLGVAIYLGLKGNELAWKAKAWESVEQFLHKQRQWSKWGIIIFCASIVLSIITSIIGVVLIGGAIMGGVDAIDHEMQNLDQEMQNLDDLQQELDGLEQDGFDSEFDSEFDSDF